MSSPESHTPLVDLLDKSYCALDDVERRRLAYENPGPLINAVRIGESDNITMLGAVAGMNLIQSYQDRGANPTRARAASYAGEKERNITGVLIHHLGTDGFVYGGDPVKTPYHMLDDYQKMRLSDTTAWGVHVLDQMESHGNITLLGALAGVGFQLHAFDTAISRSTEQRAIEALYRISS